MSDTLSAQEVLTRLVYLCELPPWEVRRVLAQYHRLLRKEVVENGRPYTIQKLVTFAPTPVPTIVDDDRFKVIIPRWPLNTAKVARAVARSLYQERLARDAASS